MADNQKYYYLRLKEDFFEDDAIQILEAMPDGYLYSNILLKLYLKSLKFDGKLMFNERIPYNATVLATITRHNVGTVEKALEIFKELGLIEILDNGAMYMLDIQNFIGKTSTEADRKRAYRERIEQEKLEVKGQMSGQISDKSTPEIEIEKEIDIDIKREGKKTRRFAPPSLEEVQKYCKERNNNINPEQFIDFYSSKGWMVGKNKMKDWKACVRTWGNREKKDKAKPKSNNKFNQFPQRDYGDMAEMEQKLLNRR